MPKLVGRSPVEVNINSPKESHIPLFDEQTRLWKTISTSSLFTNIFTGSNNYSGSINIDGNLIVSGSLIAPNITGSLLGTASWAINSLTASSADDLLVRGTLTAQRIIVQTITSSTDIVTGSTKFGTLLTNTHQFTGSVSITGSLNVVGAGITGSIFGTSSWALNSLTASYVEAGAVQNLNLFKISTGSIDAAVNITRESLFLISSGSKRYFNVSSSGNTDIYSSLFIVRDFTTSAPVFTVSQSIAKFATQSSAPVGTTEAGAIWFTSTDMYIGLD